MHSKRDRAMPGSGEPDSVPAAETPPPVATSSRSTRAVAWVMDEAISVPGTNVKIGLDPILGVFSALGIPLGDVAANTVSCVSLLEAIRRGLPFGSQAKIAGNIFLNAGFGSIPLIGDLFSFLFRSNSRNRDVINRYLAEARYAGKKPSWWRVLWSLFVVFCIGIAALSVSVAIYMLVGHRLIEWIWDLLHTEMPPLFELGPPEAT
jgi:hypothetical protein